MAAKRQKSDPEYDVICWAMQNRHHIFNTFFGKQERTLVCEMQYAIRHISTKEPVHVAGMSPQRRKFNHSIAGFVDLVIYNPKGSHPSKRIDHLTPREQKGVECLYFQVEADVPFMSDAMKSLSKLHCLLGRVPKERVVLLAPPSQTWDGIRSQGFGVVEFSQSTDCASRQPL